MEISCPRCRKTKFSEPSLKLKINVCGHTLCEGCVRLIFLRESAPCPECGKTLKKKDFRYQMFEDTRVDKEVDIRKSVLRIYNKRQADFKNLKAYNDYLEDVEDIIWSLENDINTKEVRKQIETYKKENEQLIRKNHIIANQEKSKILDTIAKTDKEHEEMTKYYKKVDQELNAERKRVNEELIDELVNDNLTPEELFERRSKRIKFENENNSELYNAGYGDTAEEADEIIADIPFKYQPIDIDIEGPDLPDQKSMYNRGYMSHVRLFSAREAAGGYSGETACKRALEDAFSGLFVVPSALAR